MNRVVHWNFNMQRWLRLWLVLATCAGTGRAVDWTVLRAQGAVSDFAGAIRSDAKPKLEQYCAEVERATGTRLLLVTLSSLEDEPLEDVTRAIFEAWRDGNGARDRRVMVLVTVTDHRQYVAVGAGVARGVADGLPGKVFREMRPALRRSDYADAMSAAAETIGTAAARHAGVHIDTRLSRVHLRSLSGEIPWMVVIGVVVIAVVFWRIGNPAGYGGSGRGLIPGLLHRGSPRRSTWGSRGSGGFGGYDSGDVFGGFGGAGCNDW